MPLWTPYLDDDKPLDLTIKCKSEPVAPEPMASSSYDRTASAPPQQHIPQQHLPQQHIPQYHIPQQHIPQQHIPQQHIPQQHLPQQHIPRYHIPQQHIPQQHIPQQHIPQQHIPQQHLPQQHIPQQHIPQQHIPQQHLPQYHYMGYPQYVPPIPATAVSPVVSYGTYPATNNGRCFAISPPESSRDARSRAGLMTDVDSLSVDPDYQAFERHALQAMVENNGGTLFENNPRMRRLIQTSQAPDDSYKRQRERNNQAAKQSRDRRKLREIQLALKVSYLKNELSKLKHLLETQVCVRCRRPSRS